MAKVKTAAEAESIIRSLFSADAAKHPYNFQTSRQGSEWVVRFSIRANTDQEPDEQEWCIESGSGRARFSRLVPPDRSAFQQETPAPVKGEERPEYKPVEQQPAVSTATDDYRAAAQQTVEGAIGDLMKEEIRSAARELVEEQKKAIRQALEQRKTTIREVVEAEKVAARGSIGEVRRQMRSLALG
jgi:polyhydroxyalkanoate synthesis regulator phasin